MYRTIAFSGFAHLVLLGLLLLLGWMPPLQEEIEPYAMRTVLIPTGVTNLAPPSAVPDIPVPEVVEEPAIPATSGADGDPVGSDPERTPRHEPPKAAESPIPDPPKETPQETPKVSPAPPVPTPQPTVALPDLPAPAAPAPSVVVEGAMATDVAQWGALGSYAQQALWRIQQNFRPSHNLPVTCEVAFRILKDGTIDRNTIRIVRSSGRADLDQSAIRALHDTAKLPELYASFKKPYLDVSVTFDYEQEF